MVSEFSYPAGQQVTVLRNGRVKAVGLRCGEVVAYDWGFRQQGRDYVLRSFVLLDDGVQINQPVTFPAQQRGWWYCDLVSVTHDGDLLRVEDLWIDVIVGPPSHPYRLLDLHEYGDAIASGQLSATDAADGLTRMQSFLDRRLNRRHEVTRTWPDFPPAAVEAMLTMKLPRDWTLIEG
jgi:hypothetical protein